LLGFARVATNCIGHGIIESEPRTRWHVERRCRRRARIFERYISVTAAVSGCVIFGWFSVGAISVIVTGRLVNETAMLSGLVLLVPSLWLLVASQLAQSMLLMIGAMVLGGLSAALGNRGSLEVTNRIAPSDQRSEVISSYLVALYCGNALPVVGIGLLSSIESPLVAHIGFAGLITVLAIIV
jgi:hypothetical protein